jgi:hypothetical protein
MVRFSKILITIGLSILVVLGCKQSKKPFNQRRDECVYNKLVNENEFYSFNKTKFQKSEILNYFNKGIIVDSSYHTLSDGEAMLYYTFKDDSSKFVLSLDNYSKGKLDFSVAYFDIKTDIFKFDNGIKINMTRSDFFKAMEIKETDCDTFDIDLNAKFSDYYYRFVFVDDKLNSIKTEYIRE